MRTFLLAIVLFATAVTARVSDGGYRVGFCYIRSGACVPGKINAPTRDHCEATARQMNLSIVQVIFILEPSEQAAAPSGKRVTVVDYPDGRLSIRYKGVELAYRTFDKIRQVDQGAIADNKRLGPGVGRADAISATPVSAKSAKQLERRDFHKILAVPHRARDLG